MPLTNDTQLALLLVPLRWMAPEGQCQLSDYITFGRTDDTPAIKLYRHLRETRRIDDDESSGYATQAVFRPENDHDSLLNVGDPYSTPDRFANTCAIISSRPMIFSRAIWSHDGFLTADGTAALHAGGSGTLPLSFKSATNVDSKFIQELRHAWEATQTNWHARNASHRLRNALTYFYYAWNSQYLQQTCINLAIVLENLFAPHAAGESTHQICFNLSRFLASKHEERKATYEFFKQFFSIRAAILHGGALTKKQPPSVVVSTFYKVCGILKTILLDKRLLDCFTHESQRKHLLEGYLFS